MRAFALLLVLASASALLMSAAPPRVTVIGLGPGSASSITRGAWSALEQPGARVFLRTSQHPAVAALPCAFSTFDALYETSSKFEDVYASIADALAAAAAAESTPVVYAVPGDPCVGEQTVALLRGRADVVADVLPGVSFLEPSLAALGVDLLPATQIVDAVLVGARAYPPFEPRSAALLCQLYSRSPLLFAHRHDTRPSHSTHHHDDILCVHLAFSHVELQSSSHRARH